jgi:hypothetical protein
MVGHPTIRALAPQYSKGCRVERHHHFGQRLPALASHLLWVPLQVLLVSEMYLSYKYPWPGEHLRAELWDNFVGIHCGGSECLEAAWCTAPLVAAVAYTLGAELGRLKGTKEQDNRCCPFAVAPTVVG